MADPALVLPGRTYRFLGAVWRLKQADARHVYLTRIHGAREDRRPDQFDRDTFEATAKLQD